MSLFLICFTLLLFTVSCDIFGGSDDGSNGFINGPDDDTFLSGPWLIPQDEIRDGGPGVDGIPSIDNPDFAPVSEIDFIPNDRMVIGIKIGGVARAYPHQILDWHEIVNDRFDGKPVAVTFCPLCYSTLVFNREVGGEILEFGVSGFLRHSDLVMFDRSTESLWQQITGEALVGEYTGTTLEQLPSQIISFEQFRETHPEGKVLSRDTGHDRAYGRNPYVGYDDIDKSPMLMDEDDLDDRLRPMEKVVGVALDGYRKAYPYSITKQTGVINDVIGNQPVVIFHTDGAASALDAPLIDQSREDGSTGAFSRIVDERELQFKIEDGKIFVSLDDADHLLTDEDDAKYVGSVTATWGGAIFHLSRKGKIHYTNFELFPINSVSFTM